MKDTTAVNQISPLHRVPTSSLIAQQLREAVMSGALAQGSQVGEAELAGRFGVSRGPLREAMQRLVQEGLLDSIPHRGLFVVELAADDIRDIYAARTAIEGAALQAIIGRPDAAGIARRLDKVVAKMHTAAARGDGPVLARSDLAFHEQLVAESGSTRLQRMASTLLVETRMCMASLTDKYVAPADLADEHTKITDAIRSGDRAAARKVMEDHMDDAVGRLAGPLAADRKGSGSR
ncbi:MAG: GntR family transcriptional regulator [Nocardioidaceae bacterium]